MDKGISTIRKDAPMAPRDRDSSALRKDNPMASKDAKKNSGEGQKDDSFIKTSNR